MLHGTDGSEAEKPPKREGFAVGFNVISPWSTEFDRDFTEAACVDVIAVFDSSTEVLERRRAVSDGDFGWLFDPVRSPAVWFVSWSPLIVVLSMSAESCLSLDGVDFKSESVRSASSNF